MSNELFKQFNQQGYIVLPNFISTIECQSLINEQINILAQQDIQEKARVVFNTQNQEHINEQYFFDSARKIKIFYEKDAFDQNGQLSVPIERAINKIGHGLHDQNSIFKQFSYQQKIKKVLIELGLKKPQIIQSMYLLKQPKIGNKVDIHQDSTFIYTEPETCVGLWFALEDATVDNGCLWALPGKHQDSLRRRLIKKEQTSIMQTLDEEPYDFSCSVPLEVAAGTLIVLHGRLPHYSNYNHSKASRHAYSLHAVDADALYATENWLQAGNEPFLSWHECELSLSGHS